MKTYLDNIEQILGITLDRDSVQHIDFKSETLKALHEFASGYAKEKIILPDLDSMISCFFPLAEILNGNFRTYTSKGTLEGHWPAFEELANLLMLCDRIIIHDHLEHYASSAIDGYVEKYRYDGLRNWLLALADWKPLIMEEIICILPPDLACSGPLQSAWDEGELSGMATGVYFEMYPEAGNFSDGSEAEELWAGLKKMEDFLTTLSIPVNRGGKFAPFYNDPDSLWLHETLVESSLNIFRREAMLHGDHHIISKKYLATDNIARLNLDAVLLSSAYTAGDICRFRLEDKGFAAIREGAGLAVRKFSEHSVFLMNPSGDFQDYLNSLQANLNNKTGKFLRSPAVERDPGKQITLGFSGMTSSVKTGSYYTPAMIALRSLFNNLPVRAQLPDSICHYYLSITDKNVKS